MAIVAPSRFRRITATTIAGVAHRGTPLAAACPAPVALAPYVGNDVPPGGGAAWPQPVATGCAGGAA
jgi:hypothetical protein